MSSKKETIKHAAIYSAAGFLGKALGFVMLPFYAHKIGVTGYGIIGMVDAATSLLIALLAYGCQGAIIRFFHREKEGSQHHVVSSGYWIIFAACGVITALAMLLSAPLSGLLFGDATLKWIFCLAMIAFFLEMTGQVASSILLIQRRSILISAVGIGRLFVGLALNIILIVWLELGVLGYFLSSAAVALLSFIIFQRIAFKECGTQYEPRIAKDIIDYQLPLIPSALISFASRQSERVFLRILESIEKVGILEMSYKFPSLIQLLIQTPFMNSWETERVRIAEADPESASKTIGAMFSIALFLLCFAALLIAITIGDLLIILTPEEFWSAQRIAQIECITVVIAGLTHHVNFGYNYARDMKAWAKLYGSLSLIKIGLSYFFILHWGLLGAAYSACLTAIIIILFAIGGGQRRFRIEYETAKIFIIAFTAFTLFLIAEFNQESLLANATQMAGYFLEITRDMAIYSAYPTIAGLFQEKLPYIIDMAYRVLIASGFLVIAPLIYPKLRFWQREGLTA